MKITEDEFKRDFDEIHGAVELMIVRMVKPEALTALAMAQAKEEDAIGLCTVREFAEMIMTSGFGHSNNVTTQLLDSKGRPWGEMSFTHKGKKYNVEMVVTNCEEVK